MTFRAERFHWGDDGGEFDWHPPVETKDWDEGKHPRAPAGTPTGGQFVGDGGGGEKLPEAPLTDADYDKMLLVSYNPNQVRVNVWITQVEAKLKELEGQDVPAFDDYSRMLAALSAYSLAPKADIEDGRDALFTVHDGNNVLKSVTHLRTGTRETTTESAHWKSTYAGLISGGTDHDAIVKNLRQAVLAYGNRVDAIEISAHKDRPDLVKAYEEAGFRTRDRQILNLPNVQEMFYGKDTLSGPAVDVSILDHLPVPLERHEGIGADFEAELARGFQGIPPKALQRMADEGIKFNVGNTLTELDPSLKGEHPRGWPPGTTWDSAEGLFSPNAKTVLIAESYRPIGQKKFVKSRRVQGALAHETGHGFDKALGNASTFKSFREAYDDDVSNIAKSDRKSLSYYLQRRRGSTAAGRSETFAELFARHAGSAGTAGTDIRQYFPSTSRLVKQAMDTGMWLEGVLL